MECRLQYVCPSWHFIWTHHKSSSYVHLDTAYSHLTTSSLTMWYCWLQYTYEIVLSTLNQSIDLAICSSWHFIYPLILCPCLIFMRHHLDTSHHQHFIRFICRSWCFICPSWHCIRWSCYFIIVHCCTITSSGSADFNMYVWNCLSVNPFFIIKLRISSIFSCPDMMLDTTSDILATCQDGHL